MPRFSTKYLFGFALTAMVATSLPSCADNNSMMFVAGVLVRKQGACEVKADIAAEFQQNGIFDRQFATDYIAALLVGNQVTQRGSRDRLRTETSNISLEGAEVRLENSKGSQLVAPYSTVGTGFVQASAGTDPGLAVMFANLIPSTVAEKLDRGTVVAKVRVFGTTLGGTEVESSELTYPIEICDGCLVEYAPADRDLTADGDTWQCKMSGSTMMAGADALPCVTGIDYQTPCTSCAGTSDICLSPDNNCAYNSKACP
jgi:hypothetical protein